MYFTLNKFLSKLWESNYEEALGRIFFFPLLPREDSKVVGLKRGGEGGGGLSLSLSSALSCTLARTQKTL